MDLLKGIAGKIVTGLLALAVLAGGISWWQMEPASRQDVWAFCQKALIWGGFVLFLPWAACLVVAWIARKDSNAASLGLVIGLTLLDAVMLGWLANLSSLGTMQWIGAIVGLLIAGVYNLLSSDWIAERMGY